jgi:hypothetical protein
MRATLVVAIVLFGGTVHAADYPRPVEADVVFEDFRFATGESLLLKVHYRTIVQPRHDKTGKELGILAREIKRVKQGQAIVIPANKDTVGHGTRTRAAVWKEHLAKLMKATER